MFYRDPVIFKFKNQNGKLIFYETFWLNKYGTRVLQARYFRQQGNV